jgi:hypothetical protein
MHLVSDEFADEHVVDPCVRRCQMVEHVVDLGDHSDPSGRLLDCPPGAEVAELTALEAQQG